MRVLSVLFGVFFLRFCRGGPPAGPNNFRSSATGSRVSTPPNGRPHVVSSQVSIGSDVARITGGGPVSGPQPTKLDKKPQAIARGTPTCRQTPQAKGTGNTQDSKLLQTSVPDSFNTQRTNIMSDVEKLMGTSTTNPDRKPAAKVEVKRDTASSVGPGSIPRGTNYSDIGTRSLDRTSLVSSGPSHDPLTMARPLQVGNVPSQALAGGSIRPSSTILKDQLSPPSLKDTEKGVKIPMRDQRVATSTTATTQTLSSPTLGSSTLTQGIGSLGAQNTPTTPRESLGTSVLQSQLSRPEPPQEKTPLPGVKPAVTQTPQTKAMLDGINKDVDKMLGQIPQATKPPLTTPSASLGVLNSNSPSIPVTVPASLSGSTSLGATTSLGLSPSVTRNKATIGGSTSQTNASGGSNPVTSTQDGGSGPVAPKPASSGPSLGSQSSAIGLTSTTKDTKSSLGQGAPTTPETGLQGSQLSSQLGNSGTKVLSAQGTLPTSNVQKSAVVQTPLPSQPGLLSHQNTGDNGLPGGQLNLQTLPKPVGTPSGVDSAGSLDRTKLGASSDTKVLTQQGSRQATGAPALPKAAQPNTPGGPQAPVQTEAKNHPVTQQPPGNPVQEAPKQAAPQGLVAQAVPQQSTTKPGTQGAVQPKPQQSAKPETTHTVQQRAGSQLGNLQQKTQVTGVVVTQMSQKNLTPQPSGGQNQDIRKTTLSLTSQGTKSPATPSQAPQPKVAVPPPPKRMNAYDILRSIDLSKANKISFDTETLIEGGIPTLKLTLKRCAKANPFTFDGKNIWKGQDVEDTCSSATITFGSDGPVTATFVCKLKSGSEFTSYRKFNNDEWVRVDRAEVDKIHVELKNELEKLKSKPIAETQTTSPQKAGAAQAVGEPEQVEYNPSADGVLNLSKDLIGDIVSLQRGEFNAVRSRRYILAREDFKVTSLVDGSETLWTAGDGQIFKNCTFHTPQSHTPLFVVTFNNGNADVNKRFVRRGNKWEPIAETEFNDRFNKMKSGKSEASFAAVGMVELNLQKLDLATFEFFDYYYDGVHTKLISAGNATVTKLLNGQETIWTPSGETFDHAKVYYKKDRSAGLCSVASTGSGVVHLKNFERLNGKWVEFEGNLDKKLDGMRNIKEPDDTVTINFADPYENDDKVTVFKLKLLGVETLLFHPKQGFGIDEIKLGETAIWQGFASQICFVCSLHYVSNEPGLFSFTIRNKDKISYKYYANKGNEWKSIEQDEYLRKLDVQQYKGKEAPQGNVRLANKVGAKSNAKR
ncbi:hypothetical protein BEWA_047930 [Theileria equi strain WA]|uniref:Signal peptide-containing protein n=1 Tax=Theileria equi strain WA TaxID=1537102 RepID=L1LA61_THEEQ|nr:hypothetical protein BEWA_047930 [Theileria equi strain WA]EKX72327.1 hypothetical protein BEWA_047930 [Theileria equi strain WA]|eukprot:XP_004831779.1 hypothetical protein BEWA_047930 [Theileria equi strain WA]